MTKICKFFSKNYCSVSLQMDFTVIHMSLGLNIITMVNEPNNALVAYVY